MLYALDPAMPVLLRPDGAVQVGWDPRRAVLVRPPDGATPAALAALLRGMQVPLGITELHRLAATHGLAGHLEQILKALVNRGVVRGRARQPAARALSIRVHGRGPLTDLMVEALRRSGARLAHTSHANASVSAATADMVVLSDYLVADPRLVRDLHAAGVPHLPVRVRDGAGLVGPLVIPGVTSCLVTLKGGLRRAKRHMSTRLRREVARASTDEAALFCCDPRPEHHIKAVLVGGTSTLGNRRNCDTCLLCVDWGRSNNRH